MVSSDRVMSAHNGIAFLDAPDGTRKRLGVLKNIKIITPIEYIDYTMPGSNKKHHKPVLHDVEVTIGVFMGTNFFAELVDGFVENNVLEKFNILANQLDPATVKKYGDRSVLVSGVQIKEDTVIDISDSTDPVAYDISAYADKRTMLNTFVNLDDEY